MDKCDFSNVGTDLANAYNEGYEQGSKDTVKEIFKKLQIIKQVADTSTDPWLAIRISDIFDEIAEQFCVEIEE